MKIYKIRYKNNNFFIDEEYCYVHAHDLEQAIKIFKLSTLYHNNNIIDIDFFVKTIN